MTAPPRPRAAPLRRLHTEEDGLTAGAEALVLGVLVFVIGAIIALNGWAVLDTSFAVDAAAREATRTIVEAGATSGTEAIGGLPDGRVAGHVRDVAVATMIGHGKDVADLDVRLVDDPWGPDGTAAATRCARVTVQVTTTVPGISLPIVGGWQTPIRAVGRHTEVIDPFRSGLTGRAECG